ncbi:hypothetical protein ACLOJK_012845 [Asimina triloba]
MQTFLISSSLLLLLLIFSSSDLLLRPSNAIGVNYGTLGDNLPPPVQVATFLHQQTIIDAVKIFSADPNILHAFANTNISVTVTVANDEIPKLTRMRPARGWVNANILPFYPATKIIRIAVGNEVLYTGDKNLIVNLLLSMKNLHRALLRAKITNIQVSTPHTLGFLAASDPPSSGKFKLAYAKAVLAPMLAFLRETKSPLMINPYPYFGFDPAKLNYALFKPNPGKYDPLTRLKYTSMFEAMLDAVFMAMKRLGYADIEIVVAETGWPSAGDPNQPANTIDNAVSYNGNLIKVVSSGKGTPMMPNRSFETYIFALFNENQKPSIAERNFGLFKPDLTPVYDVGIMRSSQSGGGGPSPTIPSAPSGSGRKWCVAKGGIADQALQANIDYVCSSTGTDCKPIQGGGACFQPNTLAFHASYVMNSYYQAQGRTDSACSFANTGQVTTTDPSKTPPNPHHSICNQFF